MINGNRVLVRPQTVRVGKMKLKYGRSNDRIDETIRIRGPTTEDLYIMVSAHMLQYLMWLNFDLAK